ncbi:hypothetical protein OCL06_10850 [Alteromonas sp. ASW11-19]|uniref:Thiamin/hydroxymethyl pyrimidine-binding YkoF putative domain-containing protein n=1 Tax=Alteromonas salexigens TaxID=2982530 RepID=A0ABT2VP55_9ALTE|nr:hypothetical protein [Alteromonas salexigens]MCU7555096.1 hypothetical protein [Alteromonas salexigens]
MQVMVELSLYPLQDDCIATISAFIKRLHHYDGLSLTTTSTSTQITGEYARVMEVLGDEMQRTHEEVGQAVFVAKFLNFDAMQSRKND